MYIKIRERGRQIEKKIYNKDRKMYIQKNLDTEKIFCGINKLCRKEAS